MERKLTRITPITNGYAVVIAQEPNQGEKAGAFIGCFLQTPECADDGPFLRLDVAMGAYLRLTDGGQRTHSQKGERSVRIAATCSL
jgi:hypothetical protein